MLHLYVWLPHAQEAAIKPDGLVGAHLLPPEQLDMLSCNRSMMSKTDPLSGEVLLHVMLWKTHPESSLSFRGSCCRKVVLLFLLRMRATFYACILVC